MNVEKVAAIGEIVSAIAIVITLLYLAIQTNQNTEAVRAAIRQGMIESEVQLLMSRAEYPERLTALCKDELTIEEAFAIQSDLIALIRMRENHWLQLQNGNLDEATWDTYRRGLLYNLATPRLRQIWDYYSGAGGFDPDFVREIADALPPASELPNDGVGVCIPVFE